MATDTGKVGRQPAFPIHPATAEGCAFTGDPTGMSLLAYFVAHAPEVPTWFEHREPPRDLPKRTLWTELPTEEHRQDAKAWLEADADLPEELAWLEKEYAVYGEALSAWKSANNMARLTQWSVFYAEAMCAALSRAEQVKS